MERTPKELKAKIEQTKRLSSLLADPQTKELFESLLKELEQELEVQKREAALVYW
jgi:hypothetical protein